MDVINCYNRKGRPNVVDSSSRPEKGTPEAPPLCNKILQNRPGKNFYPGEVIFIFIRGYMGGVIFCYKHLIEDFEILLAWK